MQDLYRKAKFLIDKASNVLLISHRKPDADTLGAALALRIYFKRVGKSATLACIDKPAKVFSFLPYIGEYVDEFELDAFDLVIIVDSGASYMTNFHLKYDKLLHGKTNIINIDHHASNDDFGKINIVDSAAASTTVIIYRMFKVLGIEIDEDMATCLLAGIYSDTGAFMHTNTCGEVYRIAAELMEAGAKVAEISKSLFRSKPLSTLKLWGQVLEKAKVTGDKVVMSVIRDEDYDLVGSNPDQLSGVIDYLNMIPDTKFAVLVNEDRNGNVKGSFRTRNDNVDLSRIAKVFGGGGHSKASGFMLPGNLLGEVRYTIVSRDMSKKSLDF